jgi:hypothetical protein
LRPYPEDRSVLVLDNCPIHKKKAVLDMVAKKCAIVLFLTPYDPDSMPIEVGFRAMKCFLRHNGKILTAAGLDLPQMLRIAARAVSPAQPPGKASTQIS